MILSKEMVIVLDFGGQYKELIASKVRNLGVYSEIHPCTISAEKIRELSPVGIILTGGPKSVYKDNAPHCDVEIFSLGIPVLGICYGMQEMAHTLGGKVGAASGGGEYGRTATNINSKDNPLFDGVSEKISVIMSHFDQVMAMPSGFECVASTESCAIAGMQDSSKGLYAVQFHPEVKHSEYGEQILSNFVYKICGAKGDYNLDDYIEKAVAEIRQSVGDDNILLALSGGVDSSVCAALIERAVPDKLTCVFVDHGMMRKNEGDEIEAVFSTKRLKFCRISAEAEFLSALKGVTESESKRKIIGERFIRIFEREAAQLGKEAFLAQGTIYPDIVESGSSGSAVIKSHHNVGGLPEDIGFKGLVEPLKGLFKDEVRGVGKKLGLPDALVNRQPFPGPGLAVRIMGEVTVEALELLRDADAIVREEIDRLPVRPDQYFAVLPGVRTVGVKGDERAYDHLIGVRAVVTTDFMTAEYAPLPHDVLGRISSRISNEVQGAGRVVYDISDKPPATIEWE